MADKNLILEPNFFMMSETDWNQKTKKTKFLNHLIDNLKYLKVINNIDILVYEGFETLLWQEPLPPWAKNEFYRIAITRQLFELIKKNKKVIDFNIKVPCCVEPDLKKSDIFLKYSENFLRLINNLFCCKVSDILICYGNEEKNFYNYFCSTTKLPLEYTPINKAKDWLQLLEIEEEFWPTSFNDIEKIVDGIRLYIEREFPEKKIIHDFEITTGFMKSIIPLNQNRYKKKIFEQMAKKLISTADESKTDNTLKDEFIENRNEWRIRVTPRPTSTRIHYKYEDSIIYFLYYYGEGEHDDGL